MQAGWREGGGRGRATVTPLPEVREIAGTQNNSRGGQRKRRLNVGDNLETVIA